MALVGSIRPGTVAKLLASVREGGASMLVMCERGPLSGRIVFKDGAVERAYISSRAEGRVVARDERALVELEAWEDGTYSLVRWGQFEPVGGPRVMVVADGDSEAMLEQRLADEGFEIRVVMRHDEVAQLARLLEPDAVVISCPRAATGHTCEEIRASIAAETAGRAAPLLITRVNPDEQAACPHYGAKLAAEREGRVVAGLSPAAYCRSAPAPMDELVDVIKAALEE